jgi:hypothetical protein
MNEVIVEGLEPKDFIILEKILKSYKVSIDSEVTFADINDLHSKVKQVIDYLEE